MNKQDLIPNVPGAGKVKSIGGLFSLLIGLVVIAVLWVYANIIAGKVTSTIGTLNLPNLGRVNAPPAVEPNDYIMS